MCLFDMPSQYVVIQELTHIILFVKNEKLPAGTVGTEVICFPKQGNTVSKPRFEVGAAICRPLDFMIFYGRIYYNSVQKAKCKMQNVVSATQLYNETNGNIVGEPFRLPRNFMRFYAGRETRPLRPNHWFYYI